jgi:hypothetical protein
MHEPCLVVSSSPGTLDQQAAFEQSYARLSRLPVRLQLVSFYDDLEEEVFRWAVQLPVAGLHLDFLGVRARNMNGAEGVEEPSSPAHERLSSYLR